MTVMFLYNECSNYVNICYGDKLNCTLQYFKTHHYTKNHYELIAENKHPFLVCGMRLKLGHQALTDLINKENQAILFSINI